jgi:hypothetical protein
MGEAMWPLPFFGLWAQATSSATANPTALAPLALRRWYGSLTLSAPGTVPGLSGLWAWLAGLAALLAIAVLFQGPGRALRQLFDVPGHVGLVVDAARRTRRAGWMIAIVIGMTVVSWTGSQGFAFRQESARGDVLLLTHTRGPVELALEQGVLAALTPLRDVAGLASNVPLLVLVTLLLFRATAESWGAGTERDVFHHPRPPGWASVGWTCGALYVLYRLVALAAGSPDLPLGGCLPVEGLIVPTVMALADGILLAWVLVELRHAGFETHDRTLFDVREAAGLMPAAALACLAILPARYVATLVLLAWAYVPDAAAAAPIGQWVRWQLSWGLADLQAAALLVAGVAGAVAWTRGSIGEALYGYARMLSAHGARLVVVFFLGGLGGAAAAALAYLAVLSLPASTWVLAAADSYAHYVTLPFGLWTLAALVELAERSLPEAALALVDETGDRAAG